MNKVFRTVFYILKNITPPIIIKMVNHFRLSKQDSITWSGEYQSWETSMKHCEGYDSAMILETCKKSLLKVKNGEAIYERDGVLFDKIYYSWALLAMLQRAALENNSELCVLDFGGSLGSSYFQNMDFLKSVKNMKWCIVEQPHFVKCGIQYFQNEELQFYYSIEECLKQNKPQVLLLSGVLQCLEQPNYWIDKLSTYGFPYIIIDRTAFIDNNQAILTVQNVPPSMYAASYPSWFFNFEQFVDLFSKNYTVLSVFNSIIDNSIILKGNKPANWKGILLQKK